MSAALFLSSAYLVRVKLWAFTQFRSAVTVAKRRQFVQNIHSLLLLEYERQQHFDKVVWRIIIKGIRTNIPLLAKSSSYSRKCTPFTPWKQFCSARTIVRRDLFSERFTAFFGLHKQNTAKLQYPKLKNTYSLDRKRTPSRLPVPHKIETSEVLLGQRLDDLLHVSTEVPNEGYYRNPFISSLDDKWACAKVFSVNF